MKNLLTGCAVLVAIAFVPTIASLTKAGVVIPPGPEHRELHSVVLFTGAGDAGDPVTLNIQALQDGDFVQYIGVVSSDCDPEKPTDKNKWVVDIDQKPRCLVIGDNALEMHPPLFSQTVKNRQITQLAKASLEGTLFLAAFLKKQ